MICLLARSSTEDAVALVECRGRYPEKDRIIEDMELQFSQWLDPELGDILTFEPISKKDWDSYVAFDLFPIYRMVSECEPVHVAERPGGVEVVAQSEWQWTFHKV